MIKKVLISVHGVLMLRRYLIVNGVSTLAMYGMALALLPSVQALPASLSQALNIYAMEHSVLGPMLNRIVLVGASVLGLN